MGRPCDYAVVCVCVHLCVLIYRFIRLRGVSVHVHNELTVRREQPLKVNFGQRAMGIGGGYWPHAAIIYINRTYNCPCALCHFLGHVFPSFALSQSLSNWIRSSISHYLRSIRTSNLFRWRIFSPKKERKILITIFIPHSIIVSIVDNQRIPFNFLSRSLSRVRTQSFPFRIILFSVWLDENECD